MRTCFQKFLVLIVSLLAITLCHARELPVPLTAALLVKVIDYEKKIASLSSVTILVVEDEHLFLELQQYQGVKNGIVKLQFRSSENLDTEISADVVFLGNRTVSVSAVDKLKQAGRLVLSDHYELLKKGVHLVLFDDEGLPGIAIRVSREPERAIQWKPEILNYATVVNQ